MYFGDMTLLSRQVPFVTPERGLNFFPLATNDDSKERDGHEITTQVFGFLSFLFSQSSPLYLPCNIKVREVDSLFFM